MASSGEFSEALERLGLLKSELARRLGRAPETVSRWGEDPPDYVWAYLDLLEKAEAE